MMVESKISPTSAHVEKSNENKENGITSTVDHSSESSGIYGIVKWYNCKFNYGFISRLDTKEDLFVHRNGIKRCNPKKFKSLLDGDIVMFDVLQTEKGAEAKNVTGPEGRPARPSRYARFRPWYLDLLQRTKQMTLDDKKKENPTERNKPLNTKQNRGKDNNPNVKEKKKEEVKSKQKESQSSISNQSSEEEKNGIDIGYASKSPSENDIKNPSKKNYRNNYRRNSKRGLKNSVTQTHHSCGMCDKVRPQVEV